MPEIDLFIKAVISQHLWEKRGHPDSAHRWPKQLTGLAIFLDTELYYRKPF